MIPKKPTVRNFCFINLFC